MKRRSLLQLTGAGALGIAAGPGLAACSGGGSGGGSVGNAGKDLAPWPAYLPFAGPQPDAPGDDSIGVQPLYLNYPAQLTQSVAETPGDGSEVTAMVVTYEAPPKPLAENSYWQEISKALGVKLNVIVVPDPEYAQKMTTLMASGGDLPDIVMFTNLNLPRRAEFIQRSCADLTDLIAGDAIKQFPNLANIPAYAWQGMGRIGGRFFGVPLERPMPANTMFVNRTRLDEVGAPVDWNHDQYMSAMRDLSSGRRWGTGWYKTLFTSLSGITFHASSAGAPNNWAVRDGGFVHTGTTPQFEQALGVMREVTKAAVHYPDSLTASSTDMQNNFYNQTVASLPNGFGFLALSNLLKAGNRFAVGLARPYSPQATTWRSIGNFGFATFKKADPSRITMLLRICDYLSAPFGSKEYELVNYGIEGKHFTKENGVVTTTALYASENSATLPVRYIGTAPSVLHLPGFPDVAKAAHEWERAVMPRSVANPQNGLQSPIASAKGGQLDQILGDGIAAISFGRKPVSSWKDTISQWRAAGGDQLAEELAKEYQANA
ncbi:putative aldouronate transport system substrate-binding protein [Actinoplanes lutulentus]|uniref:Carbohydrate ABC transporter substrate-binding protein (CUT1 family) n=1 Tax=Actinoplanes lutulentus TaxID=1287878 RepID=A0A327ZIQ9_9ACTN|nr:extracellular solute-binding protein [Actinoplanes lutulentus]MBB2947293.1 putative aldouronate transport system substrate-binding protein [Actinoplanes lutulentus]RAK36568.1 carbohydrate ABC transporter substrate-binding protein (CUT1 family) [Actinoplanes lutulentus]